MRNAADFKLEPDLQHGVLPISKAASELARRMKQARETRRPVIVTQKGYPMAAIVSVELLAHFRQAAQPSDRPTVVCLCGSTRFYEAFQRANYEETMAGRIVLSVGFYPHSSEQAHGEAVGCTAEQKQALDELHLRKIDMADEVLILNVGSYIGESTRRELAYARATGKRVRFLEPEQAPA